MYVKFQSTKTIATLSLFSSPNFQLTCIFCDKSDGDLRIARTLDIDQRVREGGLLLNDEKLIAKLSEDDMHGIETEYNANCLYSFYSKLRTIEKQNKAYYENSLIYSIFLSELVNFIKKTLKPS